MVENFPCSQTRTAESLNPQITLTWRTMPRPVLKTGPPCSLPYLPGLPESRPALSGTNSSTDHQLSGSFFVPFWHQNLVRIETVKGVTKIMMKSRYCSAFLLGTFFYLYCNYLIVLTLFSGTVLRKLL